MNELVTRLATGWHRVTFGAKERPIADRMVELRAALERSYVQLTFPDTRGGTELGTPLDRAATDLSRADLAAGQGELHIEGVLKLDYVPVRLIATLNLSTLEGQGQLRVLEPPRASL